MVAGGWGALQDYMFDFDLTSECVGGRAYICMTSVSINPFCYLEAKPHPGVRECIGDKTLSVGLRLVWP